MTWLKRIIRGVGYLLAVVIAIPLLVIAAEGLLSVGPDVWISDCPDNDAELLANIEQERVRLCADAEAAGLRIAELTPFDWDRLYINTPYSPKLSIVKQIGLEPRVLACTGSTSADEWTQLVFERHGEVVNFFDVSSYLFYLYRLTPDQRKNGVTPEEALPLLCS